MPNPYSEIPALGDRLNRLSGAGKNQVIGRLPGGIQGGSQKVLCAAATGRVRVITKIVIFTQGALVTSPAATPTSDTTDLLLIDPGGTARETLPLLVPNKLMGNFSTPARALQANTDKPLVWEPLKPLVIPERWRLDIITDTTGSLNVFVYGYEMEPTDARSLGYDVQNVAYDGTGSPNYVPGTYMSWIQTGSKLSTASPVTLVTGRTGKYVRIDDLVVRIMPVTVTGGTPEVLQLQQTDGTVLFRWVCSAVTGDPNDHVIRGPIYVPVSGQGLKLVFSSGISGGSGTTTRGTCILFGEFVDTIPEDFFIGVTTPRVPTPNDNAAAGVGVNVSNITLRRKNQSTPTSATSFTAPSKGNCLVIEGFDLSVGGGSVAPPLGTIVALATGGTADSGAAISAIGATATLLSPAFLVGSTCQQTNLTVDRVGLPCPDAAGVFVETQSPLITPLANTDILDISVTVWGRIRETTRSTSDMTMYQGSIA